MLQCIAWRRRHDAQASARGVSHKRVVSYMALEGVGKIMTRRNRNLVQALLALRSTSARYHPERHYMRGGSERRQVVRRCYGKASEAAYVTAGWES
jgi:hypothetical protein